MTNKTGRYALSVWRGEFLHGDTERAYREHVKEASARHLIVALRVWGFLLVAFGWLDYMALGLSDGFYHLMGSRLLTAFMLLSFSVMVSYRPELAKNGTGVSILEVLGFLLFFIIYFVRPDIVIWNIGVTVIILISLYIFIPNRVVHSNIVALFGIAGTLYCVGLGDVEPAVLVGLGFLLSLPTVIGYFAAVRLNLGHRQEYALFMETVQVNQSLQAEIRRREALEVELKLQATTDPLTGLLNRRQYETLFRREQERVRRHAGKLSLCVTDLDHFKKINDEHGHDVGDQVLRHISDLFVETLRHTDIVGRFGGEEFILLLPDTDLESAMVVINRLREKLQASPVRADGKEIRITATFAVTEVRAEDATIEEVIRRADKALYQGKEAGRNQVVAG